MNSFPVYFGSFGQTSDEINFLSDVLFLHYVLNCCLITDSLFKIQSAIMLSIIK